MENIIIDKKYLMKKLESLVSWEDWVEIDKNIFHNDEWPKKSVQQTEEESRRKSKLLMA